jgi:ketosteroid isomerase-like protein
MAEADQRVKERIVFRLILALMLSFHVAATLAFAHAPSRPLPTEEAAIARTVLTLREQVRAMVDTKDVVSLLQLFTEDFTHTHENGVIDGRDARIVSLLTGKSALELAPIDELLVRVHGTTTVIVSGRSPIKSSADGKTHDVRWLQVFVKSADRWQLAVSQATRLPPT